MNQTKSNQQNSDGLEASAFRAKQQEQVLAYIDKKSRLTSERRTDCEEGEECEEKARQAAVLPSVDVLEKIMRYETKLEKQKYRAMAQLERVHGCGKAR